MPFVSFRNITTVVQLDDRSAILLINKRLSAVSKLLLVESTSLTRLDYVITGFAKQPKSQTAENEKLASNSRIFAYAAILLAEVSNRIEFTQRKTRVRFCRHHYWDLFHCVPLLVLSLVLKEASSNKLTEEIQLTDWRRNLKLR